MKREVVWSIFALFIVTGVLSIGGFYVKEFKLAIYPFIVFGTVLLLLVLYRTLQHNREAIIGLVISLIVVSVIVWISFATSSNVYTLDVGAEDEKVDGISVLGPADRVSAKHATYVGNSIVTTRDLLSSLVYTDVAVPSKFKYMNIEVRFFDNFPADGQLLIGLKNGPGWNYSWQKIFDKSLDLSNYSVLSSNGLYLYYKGEKTYDSVEQFLSNIPTDKKIAVDNGLITNVQAGIPYEAGNFTLGETRLRGSFELILAAVDTLHVEFTKWDLNAYNNEDTYNISLYDLDGTYITSMFYEDDGISNISKESQKLYTDFIVNELPLGIYILNLSSNNADSSITNLWINQQNVVINKEVLILSNFSLYSPTAGLKLLTYHRGDKEVWFYPTSSDNSLELESQNKNVSYQLNISQINLIYNYSAFTPINIYGLNGDVIIRSTDYFSASPINYFEPYEYRLLSLQDYRIADFVLINFNSTSSADWKSASLHIEKNQIMNTSLINVILSAKHLASKAYVNMSIPVDYVKVSYE